MTEAAAPSGRAALRAALVLGRVSNLPTVWTNVLAGAALAGSALAPRWLALLALAMSSLYVAGMYLNDYFDRAWDARHRPERPIPSGRIAARAVGVAGAGLLLGGLALVAALPLLGAEMSWAPATSALALAALILLYDLHHKDNPLSPLLMGLCRVGVYATAGLTARAPAPALWLGCALLLAHLIGLSAVAKRESTPRAGRTALAFVLLVPIAGLAWFLRDRQAAWPWALPYAVATTIGVARATGIRLGARAPADPRAAVPWLIATLCLLDAALLAAHAPLPWLPWAAVAGFVLTLAAQRVVPGS